MGTQILRSRQLCVPAAYEKGTASPNGSQKWAGKRGLGWPLTSLGGSCWVALTHVLRQVMSVSCYGGLSRGSYGMGVVSFPFFCVTCCSVSMSWPRTGLMVSSMLPGLSKAAHTSHCLLGACINLVLGERKATAKSRVTFLFRTVTLGMWCGTDSELPGCDQWYDRHHGSLYFLLETPENLNK